MSMICKEITKGIEGKYPLYMAEDYDNVGLIIGDYEKKINKIMLCLEINSDVVREAICYNVDMIISHHPLIFKSLKKITSDNHISSMIMKLIKSDINVYAMHTNFDNAEDGMNDLLAGLLCLKKIDKLAYNIYDLKNQIPHGTGRYGILDPSLTLSSFCEYVKQRLNVSYLNVSGHLNSSVSKVAVVGGSGSNFIIDAIKNGCDTLITGDVKHHEALDAVEMGINIIDAGHYFTEIPAIKYISEFIKSNFDVQCIISQTYTNPFKRV